MAALCAAAESWCGGGASRMRVMYQAPSDYQRPGDLPMAMGPHPVATAPAIRHRRCRHRASPDLPATPAPLNAIGRPGMVTARQAARRRVSAWRSASAARSGPTARPPADPARAAAPPAPKARREQNGTKFPAHNAKTQGFIDNDGLRCMMRSSGHAVMNGFSVDPGERIARTMSFCP
jgi:hypothetical protein